jgi:hypothetical protein
MSENIIQGLLQNPCHLPLSFAFCHNQLIDSLQKYLLSGVKAANLRA